MFWGWLCIPNTNHAQTLTGTSIVAIKTLNTVFIGADSRTTATIGRDEYPIYGCKIIPLSKDCIVACAGRTRIRQFVAIDIAREIFKKTSAFDSFWTSFVSATTDSFRKLMNAHEIGIADSEILQVVLAGVVDMKVQVITVTFDIRVTGNSAVIDISTHNCIEECGDKDDILFLKGSAALREDHYRATLLGILLSSGPITVINNIIALDSAIKPNLISPPIDIIMLNRDGYTWLQKKADCK